MSHRLSGSSHVRFLKEPQDANRELLLLNAYFMWLDYKLCRHLRDCHDHTEQVLFAWQPSTVVGLLELFDCFVGFRFKCDQHEAYSNLIPA